MPRENTRRRGPQGPRRLNEFELARAKHLPTHEARIPDPPNQRQRKHDIRQARSQYGDKGNREQQAGKGQQDVDHPTNRLVDGAAEVAGNRSERGSDDRGNRDDD